MVAAMVRRGRALFVLAFTALVALAACGGDQSTLAPKSQQSHNIAVLWWWSLGVATIIWLGAVGQMLLGWVRRGRKGFPLFGENESLANRLVVVFGVVIPVVILVGYFSGSDFVVATTTESPRAGTTTMSIEVIGKQWFWEVRYPGTPAVTANEIHIPVNTRIRLIAKPGDVIHSFWIPQLNRKIDMIPGRSNSILLDADKPGRFRGQCTEFCGLQHAHMSMYVFAQPKAQFEAWLKNMATPVRTPVTAAERHGEQVFLTNQCSSCHTIRGTSAVGTVGPDLTHLQTRTTLAALTIPNREGYLAGWVLDPQHVKPGNKMPALNLSGPDFQNLLAFLESLK
jgi:cytochrome c oxidase subunit 2